MNVLQKVSYLEEAFNCVIVHSTDEEKKIKIFHQAFGKKIIKI